MDNNILFLAIGVATALVAVAVIFVFCTDTGEKYKKYIPTLVVFLLYVGAIFALVEFGFLHPLIGLALVLLGIVAAVELEHIERKNK